MASAQLEWLVRQNIRPEHGAVELSGTPVHRRFFSVLALSCRSRRRVPFAGQKNPLQEQKFMQGRTVSDIQNDLAGHGNLVKDLGNVLDCLQVFGFNPGQNQHLISRFDPGSPGNDFAAWPYDNQV